MDEKELIELSDELVQGLTKLSLGETPGFLSGSIYKKLSNHPQFDAIKECYINHLHEFKGSYDNAVELKKLTDFRYKIVELFNA